MSIFWHNPILVSYKNTMIKIICLLLILVAIESSIKYADCAVAYKIISPQSYGARFQNERIRNRERTLPEYAHTNYYPRRGQRRGRFRSLSEQRQQNETEKIEITTTADPTEFTELSEKDAELLNNYRHFRRGSGRAELGKKCDFELYSKFWRLFQLSEHLPISMFTLEGELRLAKELFKLAENETENILAMKMCKTSKYDFTLPLQCNEETQLCECLNVPEFGITTVQPIGTSGCLAYDKSYCDNSTIVCGFGFKCKDSVCSDHSLAVSLAHAQTIGWIIVGCVVDVLGLKLFSF